MPLQVTPSSLQSTPLPCTSPWLIAALRKLVTRRERLCRQRFALAFATTLVTLWGLTACAPEPKTPPHVIIWMVDTLRADHLHCYGYDRDTSPTIDSLAEGGVLFENFHVHSNWTQPSVASLLSGCYPPTFAQDFTSTVPDGLTMAAEWFRENGYATAGMTVTMATAARYGFDQGFRVYEQLDMREDVRNRKHREGPAFDAKRVVDAAVAWLDHRWPGDSPYFLYLHTVDPHAPYDSHEDTPSFSEPHDGPVTGSTESLAEARRTGYAYTEEDRRHLIDLYDDEVRYNDHELGRLMEALKERALADNTLMVVVSDHGEEFWDRGDQGHGHDNLHGELTHVPLVMNWPAGLPSDRKVAGLMRGIDMLPTLLDLCGLPPLPDADGSSVALAVRNGHGLKDTRSIVFADRAKESSDIRALRTPTRLYHTRRTEDPQLFDLEIDSASRVERQQPHATESQALSKRLDAWEQLRSHRSDEWRDRATAIPDDDTRRALEALGYLGTNDN